MERHVAFGNHILSEARDPFDSVNLMYHSFRIAPAAFLRALRHLQKPYTYYILVYHAIGFAASSAVRVGPQASRSVTFDDKFDYILLWSTCTSLKHTND